MSLRASRERFEGAWLAIEVPACRVMYDQLSNGRSIRLFNVIDDFNRESFGIEFDFSLPSERVIRSLEQIIAWRGCLAVIRCDNGPEYISAALKNWASRRGVRLEYIQLEPTSSIILRRTRPQSYLAGFFSSGGLGGGGWVP